MSYNLDSIIDSFEMIEIFKNLNFHSKEKTELDVRSHGSPLCKMVEVKLKVMDQ